MITAKTKENKVQMYSSDPDLCKAKDIDELLRTANNKGAGKEVAKDLKHIFKNIF